MDISELHSIFKQSKGVSTDSRSIKEGQLFFALKGPSFNGNAFAEKVLSEGAAFAIIDEKEYYLDERTILVEDVLTTLQELSKFHRATFKIPVLAITGSNGKTTTKELINSVLSTTLNVYVTKGNLNNHIGVPLSLLEIQDDHDVAIIEMGANHEHEIESYCKWALPDHGMITNIGYAHLEGFGSYEGVKRAKSELYHHLINANGLIFYNADDKVLTEILGSYQNKTEYASVDATLKMNNGMVGVDYHGDLIQTQLAGSVNYHNILAAIKIGEHFKVPADLIREGLEKYIPRNNRSQIVEYLGNNILLDAYNANPSSMEQVIMEFDQVHSDAKVCFLGDMLEMGKYSREKHKQILDLLEKSSYEECILVGGEFGNFKGDYSYRFFNTTHEAKKWFDQAQMKGKNILIKGSRGLKLETLIES